MLRYLIAFSVFAISLSACGKSDKMPDAASSEKTSMSYNYVADSTYVGFVAYKFTEKAGVPGWFTEFSAEGVPSKVRGADELVKNLKFSIPVSSLETGIDDRNQKIREHFFGTIDTDVISGEVVKAENGKADVQLNLNGIQKTVTLDYGMENNTFSLTGTIDVDLWDAMSGIDALNKACDILHKGSDGVSKLWSTVDLDIKTTLLPQ